MGLYLYAPQADARKLPYQDKSKPVAERVKDLLSRMTLDEKIAELNLRPYYESSDSATRAEIRKGRIGALLKANGAARNRSLQQEAMKHSRLGIPLIFHEDVIHGYRTIAPIPLAESCSWDTALVTRSAVSEGAAADGKESARRGIESGLGMDMTSGQFSRWLAQLVNDGTIAPDAK